LNGAESKDPGDAYLAYAVRSFSTTEARTWRKEAQSHSINPEFKDLAQSWG
jgi:hypothetical protein